MDAAVQSSGETEMADRDICVAVGQDLAQMYPGHPWMVGCDHGAGTVIIDLAYEKPAQLRNMAYMLHLSSMMAPGARAKVMRAGGEMLERFGLGRTRATKEASAMAKENGLIADDTAEGAHAAKKARRRRLIAASDV